MGNVAKGDVHIEYKQLYIAQQPEGGMLPKDGSGLPITVVTVEGQAPLTYTLYRDGEFVSSHTGDCDFTVKQSGDYFFYIEDATGRWATSEHAFVTDYGFSIVDYSPKEVEVNAETLALYGYPGYYLQVYTEGGQKPITYQWTWRSFDRPQPVELPDKGSMAYAPWPGIYYCYATDADGLSDKTGPMTVTAAGRQVYITEEPQQNIMWEYNSDGVYSGMLSCNAVTEEGTDERLTYSWQKKVGDRWNLLHEYDKELTVTEQGQYRCKIYDTLTGKLTYTRETLAQVKLVCVRAEQVRKTSFEFEFRGGKPPYKIIGTDRYEHVFDHTSYVHSYEKSYHWANYWWGYVEAGFKSQKTDWSVPSYSFTLYDNSPGIHKDDRHVCAYDVTIQDSLGQRCTGRVFLSGYEWLKDRLK